jgi:hypothetical protein
MTPVFGYGTNIRFFDLTTSKECTLFFYAKSLSHAEKTASAVKTTPSETVIL